ncbi:MAG: hypothetical protein ABIL09_04030 [Gemmatimonadota bacterium]
MRAARHWLWLAGLLCSCALIGRHLVEIPPEVSPLAPMSLETIPPRPAEAIGGTEFAERTADLPVEERQATALAEIRAGNVPQFLRALVPVELRAEGVAAVATVWVMPDYLAIGSDEDFLRWPFTWPGAQEASRALGLVPATTRIADACWAQAALRLRPQPMPACKEMVDNPYFLEHQRRVEEQRHGRATGQLTAGHKKDVVLTVRLRERAGRVAIYGWHHPDGTPIQPLTIVHLAGYADYSHGLRLVYPVAQVDGREVPLLQALQDPELAPLFSDEGVIPAPEELLAPAIL